MSITQRGEGSFWKSLDDRDRIAVGRSCPVQFKYLTEGNNNGPLCSRDAVSALALLALGAIGPVLLMLLFTIAAGAIVITPDSTRH